MPILALDIGTKRIGVAASDPSNKIAFGLPTIVNDARKNVLEQLGRIIRQRNIEEIVLGLPLHLSGDENKNVQDVKKWKKIIETELNIRVETWDERLSTCFAEKSLLEGDLSRKKRKKLIDQVSAQIILQDYLIYKESNKEDTNEIH